MSRFLSQALPLVLLGFLGVTATVAGAERTLPREEVQFDTVDGVQIQGIFQPGTGGKKSPCVLLLHDLGSRCEQEVWTALADALQKDGLSVLRFDFRGHGRSTEVDPDVFWQVPLNRQLVRGFSVTSPPETISAQDFGRGYHPTLVNDIAAARQYLDRRNDARECNSSTLIVVGAGDGAALGALWIASEWHRFRASGDFQPRLDSRSEGHAIAAAIWLSLGATLEGRRMPVLDWVRDAGRTNDMPTAFLSGGDDKTASDFAERCVTAIRARDSGSTLTAARAVPQTSRRGEALLHPSLATAGLVRNYVRNVLQKRQADEWQRREVQEQTYFWVFRGSGPVLAKAERERALYPVPVHALGVR